MPVTDGHFGVWSIETWQKLMQPIYYDLSELYLLARGRLKFYGIARVVAEVAYEMHRLDRGVVFVVYDETRRDFFEVSPNFGKASDIGLIDLGLPKHAVPFRLRGPKPGRRLPGKVFAASLTACLRIANRLKFRMLDQYLKPVTLADGTLFSAGRPKLLSDFVDYFVERGSKTRLHVLLHDCIPLHDFHPKPDRFQINFHADMNKIIRHASHVIANSKFTAADLLAKAQDGLLPKLPSHSVVQLAHECRADGEAATMQLPARPYVVGVGITLGRKNLDVVLEAQRLMLSRGRTPPLMVVAGAHRPRTLASLKLGPYRELQPHVLLVNNPSQANLIKLYQNALATMMPSRLEGWGLPLGESLWLGTPALAAPSSSLPEVGGDLAVYFDPDSPEQLADLLERLESEPEYRTERKRRIAEAKPGLRSWKNVAEGMLATIPGG